MSGSVVLDALRRLSERFLNATGLDRGDWLATVFYEIEVVFESEIMLYIMPASLEFLGSEKQIEGVDYRYIFVKENKITELAESQSLRKLSKFMERVSYEPLCQIQDQHANSIHQLICASFEVSMERNFSIGVINFYEKGFLIFQNHSQVSEAVGNQILHIIKNIFELKAQNLQYEMAVRRENESRAPELYPGIELSKRQHEILAHLQADNFGIARIAHEMNFSQSLIKKELACLYKKFGAENKSQLVHHLEKVQIQH
jgi:DNA-binding CsgD family transcriptional regulator